MTAVLAVLLALSLLVGFVVFFGPPYLPTMRRNIDAALDLLELKPGQTLLELGSGDGRVLVAAAKRGISVVGIELSPLLFLVSWASTRRYRKHVRVIWGNYFLTKWPDADAIFTFMIPRHMPKLDRKIEGWRGTRSVKLASFAFHIPGKEPDARKAGVFLYRYNSLRQNVTSVTMSSMKYNRQGGFVSTTLLSLIAAIVLLVGALSFGVWAFMGRQDYKNNTDEKIAAAVAVAKKATEAADAKRYAEEAKRPLVTHKGPAEFGAVAVQYPKTWSAYVVEGDRGGTPVDNYFHPRAVPDVSDKNNAFALRVQVLDKTYDSVLKTYENEVNSKKLKARPYVLPKVAKVVGTRLDGQVDQNKQGSLIVLPMRNMTLLIWSESPSHIADLNNIILPNISFVP